MIQLVNAYLNTTILNISISVIAVIAFSIFMLICFKPIAFLFVVIGSLIAGVGCVLFGLTEAGIILLAIFIVLALVFIFGNIADIRRFISKSQPSKKKLKAKNYNKEELYHLIDETVHELSRHQIGALITFERAQNLDEIMKSGTIINAPVNPELLQTIFFPKTRLHDGAVIIRDNMIIAAAVYYTPTNRPLTGKYGSRHRAAYGIAEISDSVTVVVSEETGRVSIAHNSQLEPVALDNFYRTFSDIMSASE